ncbi:MAG: class I SAM-dependent methyltransferase [Gammaproteobacteria bacterium]
MTNPIPDEMRFLESVTHTYVTSESPQDRTIKSLAIRAFAPYIRPGSRALEFGCCDGYMTSLISSQVDHLTVVDGSSTFIQMAQARQLPNVSFTHVLFENFTPDHRFDCIFATYVLEHVADAVGLLRTARGLLDRDGLLFLVVPNARAMSRQLARHMGLIDDLYALTPNDVNHGHRRVYDRILLNRDIEAAGLTQVGQGGLMLKPLADFQMNTLIAQGVLGETQIDGLYKMGLEYPDLSGSLFSVCRAA